MVKRELPMEKYTILPVCNMKICLNLCFIVIHLVLEATLLKNIMFITVIQICSIVVIAINDTNKVYEYDIKTCWTQYT